MKMGMIIGEVNGDDIAEFVISDTQQLEAYLREICKRLGIEYGSEPIWDSYHWDTGGDYFEDVFTSKKGIFVLPYRSKTGKTISIFDNLFDLLEGVEKVCVNTDNLNGGVYSFTTMNEACKYIKDLKNG